MFKEKEIHREEVIRSHPQPFKGQRHRSSGNFSTRYIHDSKGEKPQSLFWEIIPNGSEDAGKISFQVYEDVPMGIDRKKFKGKRIKHGDRTAFIDERKIYIYLPQGAKGAFDVRVSGSDLKPTPHMIAEAEDDIALETENGNEKIDETED